MELSDCDPHPTAKSRATVEPCDLQSFLVELDRPSQRLLHLTPSLAAIEGIVEIRHTSPSHGGFDGLTMKPGEMALENLP